MFNLKGEDKRKIPMIFVLILDFVLTKTCFINAGLRDKVRRL